MLCVPSWGGTLLERGQRRQYSLPGRKIARPFPGLRELWGQECFSAPAAWNLSVPNTCVFCPRVLGLKLLLLLLVTCDAEQALFCSCGSKAKLARLIPFSHNGRYEPPEKSKRIKGMSFWAWASPGLLWGKLHWHCGFAGISSYWCIRDVVPHLHWSLHVQWCYFRDN